jgi:hypothetical protein
MSTIPPDARKHRKEFMTYVINKAAPWYLEHLGDLYHQWEGWNRDFFDNQLVPPYILLAEPSSPRNLGDFGERSCFGGITQIRVRPSLVRGTHRIMRPGDEYAAGRRLFVRDVALHETVHHYCHEVLEEPEDSYKGHGPVFARECNRIGELLGLPPVRAKARGQNKHLPPCSHWPHNVRPEGYYQGAVVEGPGRTATKDRDKAEPPDLLEQLLELWALLTPEQQDRFRELTGQSVPTKRDVEPEVVWGPVVWDGDKDTLAEHVADVLLECRSQHPDTLLDDLEDAALQGFSMFRLLAEDEGEGDEAEVGAAADG